MLGIEASNIHQLDIDAVIGLVSAGGCAATVGVISAALSGPVREVRSPQTGVELRLWSHL
jgi:hypothetical protein